MRRLLVLALLTACSTGDGQSVGAAGHAAPVAPAEPAPPVVPAQSDPPRDDLPTAASEAAPPLELDALLPSGEGWKCVLGRCERSCVYPRPTHAPGPGGRVVTLSANPPCVDSKTAFCAAFAAPPRHRPSARCWATRAACEAERSNAALATTACEER